MSPDGGSEAREAALDIDSIYSIIGNQHKRRIIAYLGEHGEASFSELKRALKVSVGNLYYNLDGLAGFVAKNEKRRYYLTEEGIKLYRWIRETEPVLKAYISKKPGGVLEKYVLSILVPIEFMSFFYKQRVLGAVAAAAAIVAGILSSLVTRGAFFLLEYLPLEAAPLYIRAAVFLGGLAVAVALVEFLSRTMGFHRVFQIDFLGALGAALLPVYMAPPLLYIAIGDPLARNVVFRILQVGSLGLLTAAISVHKDMPKERAFIIVFTLYYVGFLAHLLVGGV